MLLMRRSRFTRLLPCFRAGSSMSATDTTRTDIHGWRLFVSEDSHGQHKWVYLPADDPRRASWPQSTVDKYWLGLETVRCASLSVGQGCADTERRAQKSFHMQRIRKRRRAMGLSFTSRFSLPMDTGLAHTAVRPGPSCLEHQSNHMIALLLALRTHQKARSFSFRDS